MSFLDYAAVGLGAVYDVHGFPASWQRAAGGDPIPCRVIKTEPTSDLPFGQSRARTDTHALEVRACEVDNPTLDDIVTVQARNASGALVVETFQIMVEPPRDDAGLIWLCEADLIEP